MYKILRIVCSIISALLVAACVFLFIYLGTAWGIVAIFAAVVFFVLTLLFKSLQEDSTPSAPPVQNEQPNPPSAANPNAATANADGNAADGNAADEEATDEEVAALSEELINSNAEAYGELAK